MVQDKVISLESVIEARERERSDLALQLNLSTSNETRALEERNHLRAETQQLRNQLSRTDAELQLSSAELGRLRETLARAEQQHAQTEAEALRANREKEELAEAVTAANRQVNNLTEETEKLRRELGQQAGIISRLNEEREEMIRDKDDLSSRVGTIRCFWLNCPFHLWKFKQIWREYSLFTCFSEWLCAENSVLLQALRNHIATELIPFT